jgi:hypothetical protein
MSPAALCVWILDHPHTTSIWCGVNSCAVPLYNFLQLPVTFSLSV